MASKIDSGFKGKSVGGVKKEQQGVEESSQASAVVELVETAAVKTVAAETQKRAPSEGICDKILMNLPPRLQGQIDEVLKTLDSNPINLTDMRSLGYRILKKAEEASEGLKRVEKKEGS